MAGELAYNAERVLALEERGHRLYGLWTPDPLWFNTVGPLPFGHVQDFDRARWRDDARAVQPDVIYGLLNWQAVPFLHHVLETNPGIPFVFHFKEAPQICLEKGSWNELVDLCTRAHGVVYSSPEMRDWFEQAVPATAAVPHLVLDGDLPKRDWLMGDRSPRISNDDGEIHTVVPGRPIGLHPEDVKELSRHGIHLHFYGDFTHGQWKGWIDRSMSMAPDHLHLHANIDQEDWVAEFSRYDAGWLHYFESHNGGDMRAATWDDLNYPARIATLAAAGLPLLQRENCGHVVATQALARSLGIGVFGRSMEELAARLHDGPVIDALRESAWRQRDAFTFDHHAERLIDFLRAAIASAQGRGAAASRGGATVLPARRQE
jgi:hypothetical protein